MEVRGFGQKRKELRRRRNEALRGFLVGVAAVLGLRQAACFSICDIPAALALTAAHRVLERKQPHRIVEMQTGSTETN